jgi:hypothetical protein
MSEYGKRCTRGETLRAELVFISKMLPSGGVQTLHTVSMLETYQGSTRVTEVLCEDNPDTPLHREDTWRALSSGMADGASAYGLLGWINAARA